MGLETLTNKTMFCHDPSMINSNGIWHGKNPLLSSVPLLLTQLTLISLASKTAEICLRPLGQSSIVSQILVSITFHENLQKNKGQSAIFTCLPF